MSITLTPTQAALSGSDAVLVDHIGNEVYAAHYTERRLSRFVIGTLAVLLVGSFTMIHSLANRPLANRYVRIDEMGPRTGHPVFRSQLQPARGRGANLPHRLGQLPVHREPRDGGSEVHVHEGAARSHPYVSQSTFEQPYYSTEIQKRYLRPSGCCVVPCPACGVAAGEWCVQDGPRRTARGFSSMRLAPPQQGSSLKSAGTRSATRTVRGWTRPEHR